VKVWAIGDPHLSFQNGVLTKPMSIFGKQWENHPETIKKNWEAQVKEEDVVFVVGDISWAKKLTEVVEDLAFLGRLPGKKVFIKGNHDFWWTSLGKAQGVLPAGCTALNGGIIEFEHFVVGGLRLWDIPGLNWEPFYHHKFDRNLVELDENILEKETRRFENCLELMKDSILPKILLLHYPPSTPDLVETFYTKMIEKVGIKHCIFGHLHDIKIANRKECYGEKNGVTYHLTACDWVNFSPVQIAEF
jgi:predicted phosphohydrolase